MVSMADVTPDPPALLPQNTSGTRRRVVDVVAAFVLVFGQLVLYCGSFMALGLMVMGTDSCAYEACGDQAWLNRAMHFAGWGGAGLLVVTVIITLLQIVRHRVAWFVPAIGCVAQLGLGFACAAMEMQAGPLRH
jgi:hypothetical protein